MVQPLLWGVQEVLILLPSLLGPRRGGGTVCVLKALRGPVGSATGLLGPPGDPLRMGR